MGIPTRIPYVGVGVLIRRRDEWLLLRRKNAHGDGTWSTPGGHLEFGESPSDCARREAVEETGLTLRELTFVGVTNDLFDARLHYVTLWFEAEGAIGDARLADPEEVAKIGWFREDDLPEPLFPPLRRLVSRDVLGPGLRRHP